MSLLISFRISSKSSPREICLEVLLLAFFGTSLQQNLSDSEQEQCFFYSTFWIFFVISCNFIWGNPVPRSSSPGLCRSLNHIHPAEPPLMAFVRNIR